MCLHNEAKAKKILVQVGVHQASVVSPLLCAIAMNRVIENAKEGVMNKVL